MSKKVVIAMSGGVDSSVAAALLVEQGYEVTGMMLKLWSSGCQQLENACCTPESIAQARMVSDQLNIPFYVQDAKDVFKNRVVDPFIQNYQNGITPNPCFVCNQTIKWGYLLEKAISLGADFLATGHYARLESDEKGMIHLFKGTDPKKDQSYVLSGLHQSQFARTLLPLGSLLKTEVRELAAKFQLQVANKPDSQDLCFVGSGGYRNFMQEYGKVNNEPGNICNSRGKILGKHSGLANYTIGQRKGLGSGFGVPYYVLEINVERNEIIVGLEEELGTNEIVVHQFNWVLGIIPNEQKTFQVKIRYKAKPIACRIKQEENNCVRISLEEKVRDATPGQIAVIYDDEEVLGSGVIISAEREKL